VPKTSSTLNMTWRNDLLHIICDFTWVFGPKTMIFGQNLVHLQKKCPKIPVFCSKKALTNPMNRDRLLKLSQNHLLVSTSYPQTYSSIAQGIGTYEIVFDQVKWKILTFCSENWRVLVETCKQSICWRFITCSQLVFELKPFVWWYVKTFPCWLKSWKCRQKIEKWRKKIEKIEIWKNNPIVFVFPQRVKRDFDSNLGFRKTKVADTTRNTFKHV